MRKSKQTKLWSLFDSEVQKPKVECVYTNDKTYDFCSVCKSNLGLNEDGFYVCTNIQCGILYTDVLDLTAEWRYYGVDDNHNVNPTRCGMPINPLLKESSYGCEIICEGKTTYEMRKISRYARWHSMPYKEKAQYNEFQHISIMANISGIPKMIVDEACKYHKDISEKKTFRGLNRDGIIAASIYIACRIEKYPRTAKEIAKIFNLDTTSATKGCKNAMAIINELEHDKHEDDKLQYAQYNPLSFIERYCSKLNINKEFTKLSQFIAIQIEKKNMMPENTPPAVAAGIIYFISQEFTIGLTKKDINSISEISEVTINKCYKKLVILKDSLIPSGIRDKYRL